MSDERRIGRKRIEKASGDDAIPLVAEWIMVAVAVVVFAGIVLWSKLQ